MGQHNRFDQDAERGPAEPRDLSGGSAFSVVIAAISTSEAF
jgi:hypothetical protein